MISIRRHHLSRLASAAFLLVLFLRGSAATAVAGDLLRGGYTSNPSNSSNPTSFTPPSVSAARANAQDALARATQAIAAVEAMQSHARTIAAGVNNLGTNPNNLSQTLPNVPNGLGVGGLNPSAGATAGSSLWTGADLPTQTTSNGRTIVTVDQTNSDAVLTWQSFNVGSATTLKFNQSAGGQDVGNWIVFNVVTDPSGVPSQILGSIQAQGQVYVINQNGIIFGGASQVNVHALVASSLPINDYLIGVGLVNNPDDQFLFSSITVPALASDPTAPTFTPPPAPNGYSGDVTVEAGAVLQSPADAAGVGGKIALVGPNVTNAGTIYTPDGQTILAAGQQVGFLPHPESDPSLRGLDVYIGQGGGTAINSGEIYAPEADVTVMGASVQQLGTIESTTSVSLNGRIDLKADWGTAPVQIPGQALQLETTEAGSVTFGNGSITDILPEVDSSATITSAEPPPDQALALPSQVNVQGETIHMAGDAELLAPNATVNMLAGEWLSTGEGRPYGFEYTAGQIYLDSGALVDVAGTVNAQASVTQNIVAVQLLGPELADSPLQRNGPLAGQTIYVDIRNSGVYDGQPWIGTPLADVYGYASLIEYTAAELTTAGGTVNMEAGGSVVMQKGSEVNVSGGYINYSGGIVTTSDLISGGYIYNIADATPDLVYSGFLPEYTLSNAKWGTSATYNDPLITDSHYEEGYDYGGAGGTVNITAPATALQGTLLGLTINGPRQAGPDATQAVPSAITIAFEGQNASNSSAQYPIYAPTPPTLVFSTQDDLPAAAPFSVDSAGNPAALSTELSGKVILSPDLFTTDGFGNLTVRNGDGSVTLPAGVTLDPGIGGSITLAAANMTIAGSILAPGGSISLTTYDYSPYSFLLLSSEDNAVTPPPNPDRGNFILASGASLDVAGLLIDNRDGAPGAGTLPMETAGGSVSIDSYNANLEAGSSINVSGGVSLNSAGTPSYGAGGSISILAGSDPNVTSLVGGHLELNATLMGYSGGEAGSLTLGAMAFQIGGAAPAGNVVELAPSFFDQGGFGSFTLNAVSNIDIGPNTILNPVADSLVALAYAPGGAGLQTTVALLPVNSRTPVSLAFDATGVTNLSGDVLDIGHIVMGPGSLIQTDPLGDVTMNGQTVAIMGSIFAPGGAISITAGNTSQGYGILVPSQALPTLYISPQTTISAAGTTVSTPNSYPFSDGGYVTGYVVNGGSITLSGNIVAEAGAVLNVSGASGVFDESPVYSNPLLGLNGATASLAVQTALNGSYLGAILVPTDIQSNAGSINLKGNEELFTDATLIGDAGGAQALGGTLTVSSGIFNPTGDPIPPSQVTLIVTESGATIGGAVPVEGQTPLGHAVLAPGGQTADPLGRIAVSSFGDGGFDNVNIEGTVEFSGPVDISAGQSITVATNGILYANGAVNLAAPYVTLGTPFQPPTPVTQEVSPLVSGGYAYYIAPTYGTGSLTVTAQLIDIGNLSLQDIGKLNLIANNGAIQGDGTLDVAGNIVIQAAQVFPPTETTFTIAAYNYTDSKGAENGSVTIIGSGEQPLPLSAGGVLNIYASDITQDGVVEAPFGVINLGWDGVGTAPVDPFTNEAVDSSESVVLGKGSITSVSAVDPYTGQGVTIPYGLILNGISWIDPSGVDITTTGAPQKAVNISASNVTEASGATIDIRGGGDLFAYEFIPGIGGDTDILDTNTSYAIIPGYPASYAPYAPYNPDRPAGSTELANLGTDPGYVNSTLVPGESVYLAAGSGLAAGTYTLLPARYAAMPGAYLITPLSGSPGGSGLQPDGASIVAGYSIGTGQAVTKDFEVEPPAVVASEAEYDTYSGTQFLGANSAARTPADSGELILQATQGMNLEGTVLSRPLDADAQGGLVEIESSPSETIFIAGLSQTPSQGSGDLVLDSSQLSSIGAQTLLIGGYASTGANGTTVTVESDNIVVDNSGAPLSGGDVILVANDNLTLDQGASISSAGSSDHLVLDLTGDGGLVRVSSNSDAEIVRSGVVGAAGVLSIGQDVNLSGGSVILDSSMTSTLDPSAKLDAKTVTIDSGLISIVLDDGNDATPGGLVLSGNALQQIQAHTSSLTLLSYSDIDIYGTGGIGSTNEFDNLTLSAADIDGFEQDGGTATLAAKTITLEGDASASSSATPGTPDGTLAFDGGVIHLGANALRINQYASVQLNGAGGIISEGDGSVTVQGGLSLSAPIITGAAGSQESISAGGAVTIAAADSKSAVPGGLAATLTIAGAGIDDNGDISLPSGTVTLQATSGNLVIGNDATSEISVAGIVKNIFDLSEYTPGGTINLEAASGNVTIGADGTIDVAAPSAGGNAGTLNVEAPQGTFTTQGTLLAQNGAGGQSGNFSLQISALPTFSSLGSTLDAAGFTQSIQIEVETGDVTIDGNTTAQQFELSTDAGSITVTGKINASGNTGGEITLNAAGSVTLDSGATLDASAQNFDNAGKGGAITLSAGADINGVASTTAVVDLEAGSTVNLSVAANNANSQNLGDFTGTLLISAPQNAAGTDVQVAPIDGTITGASAIVVEGYRIYNLTSSGGQITSALENQIYDDGVTFLGADGVTTASYTAMMDRLLANNPTLPIYIETGAEIINLDGNLTLGTTTAPTSSDWDLQNDRFGPDGTAGQLTMRASGNLIFYNSLSDGFDYTQSPTGLAYDAPLLSNNTSLPANIQSWSYTLTAGANLAAANPSEVIAGAGSLELGRNDPDPIASSPGSNATTESILDGYYQVIRTGAGNIDINAGDNVELLNQFATIYTAGTQVIDPTMGGTFDVPEPDEPFNAGIHGELGYEPIGYPAQYSEAGGNVSISAGNDIEHLTLNSSGQLVEDSERELPNNWLYRRGYVDSSTGQFGYDVYGDISSTTWWVDFSNFFEGVGTLGGGNVTLTAGQNVANLDAVAATNARMPMGTPSASALLELGGGNVTVTAGDDINAGVYYVGRGVGTLTAGNQIITNSTRSATLGTIVSPAVISSADAWLPTTLFLGQGDFTVTASENLLLGPVANVFLLPEGLDNTFWYKTYFSTYAASDSVTVTSLAGNVTLREDATSNGGNTSVPLLETWMSNVDLLSVNSVSNYQPWLRLDETSVSDFDTAVSLMPPTLRVAALSGDIDIAGNITLSPAPDGTLDLLAAGSINAMQPNGQGSDGVVTWNSSTINVSDASPADIPGPADPYAYESVVGISSYAEMNTGSDLLQFLDLLFEESAQTGQVLQEQQELHAPGLLHADDTTPVYLYSGGSISGLTLYSPEETRVIAAGNITDISLYIQNDAANDISVVAAGNDIIAYDPDSPLRTEAEEPGNYIEAFLPNAGDIQISGPGTLEVLAGSDLNLGVGPNYSSSTGVGITSIGNQNNPYLPQTGANIIAAGGMGPLADLSDSHLDFTAFINQFVTGPDGAAYLAELPEIATGFPSFDGVADFDKLSTEDRDIIALDVFFLVLRDAGRDYNIATSPGYGNYDAGYEAIADLFPDAGTTGDVSLTSREIATENGGDVAILDPGGSINVGVNVTSNQPLDQGIFTEDGGNVSIFANGSVNVGTSRIFTLRGGNEIIWSTTGNIDAGNSPKTVQEAPPTQVIVDPQSANVTTDLGGLATGGGIGVLASIEGVPPGNVDLIAPVGTVNAGDAGIRVTGNLNIAAAQVLNVGNIQVGGASTGVPVATVVAPNVTALAAASSSAGAGAASAAQVAAAAGQSNETENDMPSIVTVQVLGYGGDDSE